ncbi:MAG: tetratricopeptide repeat protein [Candidatus Thorarchaeota archaeon]
MNEIEKLVRQSEQLRENDRIVDAEDLVRKALEKYEESWHLYLQLGLILSRKQEYVEAADAFLTATNLEPEEFWPWLYLGCAQRDLGDYEAAIEAMENAVRVEIGERELNMAYYYLASYNALLGRNEEAMDYLRTALENDKSLREWAREDEDLDSLRNVSGFEFLSES